MADPVHHLGHQRLLLQMMSPALRAVEQGDQLGEQLGRVCLIGPETVDHVVHPAAIVAGHALAVVGVIGEDFFQQPIEILQGSGVF